MAPSNGTTSTVPCNGTLVPRPMRQSGWSPSPLLEVRTPIAIAIWGKTEQQTKVYHHRHQISDGKNPFCVINVKKNAPNHSTLQWQPKRALTVHSPKVGRHPPLWHPAMAPRHPAMAPNGTTSTLSGTLQWHPATALPPSIAHYNGTLQWHHVHSPKVGRHPPPQPYHTTMAPRENTQQWHHVLCTLQWHPGATSNPPKWFVTFPPYWK